MSDSSFNPTSISNSVSIMMRRTLLIYKIGSNKPKNKTPIRFQLRTAIRTINDEQINEPRGQKFNQSYFSIHLDQNQLNQLNDSTFMIYYLLFSH